MFTTLTNQQKGIIYMIIGLVLLLFTLGIFEKLLGYLIITGSILLVGYGFIISGYAQQLQALIKR